MHRQHLLVLLCVVLVVAQTAVAQEEVCGATPGVPATSIYFANGIWNDLKDAVASTDLLRDEKKTELEALRDDDPECEDERYLFNTAYNNTQGKLTDIVQVLQQKATEFGVEDEGLTGYEIYSWVTHGLSIEEVRKIIALSPNLGLGSELITAEILELLADVLVDADVNAMLETPIVHAKQVIAYDRDLRAGARVIVIAHSQGNLFTDAAVRQVRELNPDAAESIGVLGVATPSGAVLEGGFYEYITALDDGVINTLIALGGVVVLEPYVNNDTGIFEWRGFLNHPFAPGYFAEQLPSRVRIDALLAGLAETMPFPPPDSSPPTIPQNVEAVASAVGQISISWSPSTDNSGFVASYEVYRGNETIATVTETTAVDSGLAGGTEYCYTVRALDLSGNRSDETAPPVCATTQIETSFAVTGWTVVAAGDPGIPGDGILIGDDVECGDTACWAGEEPAVKLLRPEADGFTVSLYMTNIFDAIPEFDFVGSPLGRCIFSPGAFYEGRSTAPTINGVSGESFSYSRATLEQIAADIRQNRPQYCTAASEADVYLYQIRASAGANSAVDGIFIGTGQDIFPEPPVQDPGWVSFGEGDAGVPGDGLTVAGSPRHTIQSPLSPLGSTADGLTLSIYGASPDTFDEIVFGYSGYPACSYTLPLSGGLLNDAPPYSGVAGKFYAINRQFFAQFAGAVAAANPAQCADVSADDSYFASFVLGGAPRELDAAYIASGFVVFP